MPRGTAYGERLIRTCGSIGGYPHTSGRVQHVRLSRILIGVSLLLTAGAVFVGFAATTVMATEAAPNVIKEITQPDGKVIKVVWGKTHTAKPAFDIGVEKGLKEYFDKYHTIQMDNFKVSNDEIAEDGRGGVITHMGRS